MSWIAVGIGGASLLYGVSKDQGWLGGSSKSTDASASSSNYNPFMLQYLYDPLKQAVASPLSSYLAGEIGKGLPRYPGELTAPLDADYMRNYQNFVGINPTDYFSKNIQDPATAIFKRDFDPMITENYAGNLRGSGRAGAQEDAINRFSQALSLQRGEFVPSFSQAQLAEGRSVQQIKTAADQALYQDWWKSLPENNPVISQAIQFLNNSTGTGTDILAALNQGQNNWMTDLMNTLTTGLGSLFSSKSSGSTNGTGFDLSSILSGLTGSSGTTGSVSDALASSALMDSSDFDLSALATMG